jgi:TRAP-type transport system small permease protein
VRTAARVFGAVAAFFLAGMVLITVADVVLRSLFNFPIRGVLELVELGLACTIFIALPAVFLRDEHLVVDVIDHVAPRAVVRWLDLAGALLSAAVLAVMAWRMLPLARDMHAFGDVTADLAIPKLWYWVPVLVGVVASLVATLAFIIRGQGRN